MKQNRELLQTGLTSYGSSSSRKRQGRQSLVTLGRLHVLSAAYQLGTYIIDTSMYNSSNSSNVVERVLAAAAKTTTAALLHSRPLFQAFFSPGSALVYQHQQIDSA
eukprot:GHUV01025959.1.p2 GENE.GHUV01025959.1~~GHUV01025959.1.p2  ORF type:complete len:106 (+),score=18.54 GHUV01025959.1:765-1082(+)